MQDGERLSLEQIQAFLEASDEIRFNASDRLELYEWMERTLVEQKYAGLGRASKGLVRRYVAKMTGLSRAQVTRLIGQYRARGEVKATVVEERVQDIAILMRVCYGEDSQVVIRADETAGALQRLRWALERTNVRVQSEGV